MDELRRSMHVDDSKRESAQSEVSAHKAPLKQSVSRNDRDVEAQRDNYSGGSIVL